MLRIIQNKAIQYNLAAPSNWAGSLSGALPDFREPDTDIQAALSMVVQLFFLQITNGFLNFNIFSTKITYNTE